MGILDVVVGAEAARRFRRNRRAWRARRVAAVRPSDAKAGEIARVAGRVEAAGELVTAPFTQASALFFLVRLEQKVLVDARDAWGLRTSGDELVRWREEIAEASTAPFQLVDDAGARVIVDPRFALCAIDAPLVNEHPHVNDENPALSAFLRSRGVLPTQFMGIAGETRFYELRLRPGDGVSIYGRLEEHASVRAEGYRDAPERLLRMTGTDEEPLVILPA